MDKIQIKNLSASPKAPCYLLEFNDVGILLDCPLDISTVLQFMPLRLHSKNSQNMISVPLDGERFRYELHQDSGFIESEPLFGLPFDSHINYATIDVILISNYTNMLALPYLTEQSGFVGKIYATEPTFHFGRIYMQEMIENFKICQKQQLTDSIFIKLSEQEKLKLPSNINQLFASYKKLLPFYTKQHLDACLNKIQLVNYLENIDLFGILTCYPTSAGYSIGSCNWVLKTEYEKFVYISRSSILTAHPKPIDLVNLRNPDVLLITDLTKTPQLKPDSMITEFSKIVISTIKVGGNVLVPCPLSGLTLDLLECLNLSLSMNMKADFSNVPSIYFVCPEVKSALAYANIFSEWLCTNKQVKVYLPEEPFIHADMIDRGNLHYYNDVSEITIGSTGLNTFKTPCIVLAGHPSLRFGPVVHFLDLWKSQPRNTILFVDTTLVDPPLSALESAEGKRGMMPANPTALIPEAYRQALKPYGEIYARVAWCPIDTGLNPSHVRKLLKDCKPKRAVVCPTPLYETLVEAFKHVVDEGANEAKSRGDSKDLNKNSTPSSIISNNTSNHYLNLLKSIGSQPKYDSNALDDFFQSLMKNNDSTKLNEFMIDALKLCQQPNQEKDITKTDKTDKDYPCEITFDRINPYRKVRLIAPQSPSKTEDGKDKTAQSINLHSNEESARKRVKLEGKNEETGKIPGTGYSLSNILDINVNMLQNLPRSDDKFGLGEGASSSSLYLGPQISGVLGIANNQFSFKVLKVNPFENDVSNNKTNTLPLSQNNVKGDESTRPLKFTSGNIKDRENIFVDRLKSKLGFSDVKVSSIGNHDLLNPSNESYTQQLDNINTIINIDSHNLIIKISYP